MGYNIDRWFTEDFYKLTDDLAKFKKYKKFFKNAAVDFDDADFAKYSDINQMQSFADIYHKMSHLEPYIEREIEGAEMKSAEKDAKKIYTSDNFIILTPETEAASCAYGRGTRWCTASTGSYNYFKSYNNQGPLYIIIDRETQEKFQFHFQTQSYMDKDDNSIDWDDFFEEDDGHRMELKPKISELATLNGEPRLAILLDPSLFDKMHYNYKTGKDYKAFVEIVEDDMDLLLKLAKKSPSDATAIQDYFIFEGDDVWINTQGVEWSDLVKFIKDIRRYGGRSYAKSILENGGTDENYYDYGYEEYMFDYVSEEHMKYIQRYIKSVYGEDISLDDIPKFADRDIARVISGVFSNLVQSETSDKLYNGAIDAIVDGFGGKYEFIDGNIWFKWTRKELERTWKEIDVDGCSSLPSDFVHLYATDLDETDKGGDFDIYNLANNYPDVNEKNKQAFNEFLADIIEDEFPIDDIEEIEECLTFDRLINILLGA